MSATVHAVAPLRDSTTQPQRSGAMPTANQIHLPKEVIEAIDRGASIIPLRVDKRPLVPWKPFQSQAATREQIEAWALEHSPTLWGIVCGPVSGIVVLDFDGETGNATMRRLGLDPHFRTPSGGHHVYFKYPGWRIQTLNCKSQVEIADKFPGMDIRATGGYAALSGKNQKGEYVNLRSLRQAYRFEDLPESLRNSKWLSPPAPVNGNPRPAPAAVPDSSSRVSAERLIRKALDEAHASGRNNGGFLLACQCRDNGYSKSEAESIVLDYQQRTPATNQKGGREKYAKGESLASVREAYSASPRAPWAARKASPRAPWTPQPKKADSNPPNLLAGSFTSHGFAVRFVEHGDGWGFRYVHERKQWYVYDGRRWVPDHSGEITHAVVAILKETAAQVQESLDQQKGSGNEDDDKQRKKELEALKRKCISSETSRAVQDILGFVRGLNRTVSANDFDKDPYAFNCSNGTLDLRTGELRPHGQEDLISKISNVDYDPDAKCPTFLKDLNRSMKSYEELTRARVEFLQKAAGLSLSGDVSEKAIFVLVGETNAGKTTVLGGIRNALGDYAGVIRVESLIAGKNDNNTQDDLGDLIGKRFVTSSESDKSQRLSHTVKNLSQGAGAPIKAARKHEHGIEFLPTHKLWIDTNKLPKVDLDDTALWARFQPVKFDNQLSNDEIDRTFHDQLRAEADGILAWCVEGFRKWQNEGLGKSPDLESVIQSWREQSSPLADFFEDLLEPCRGEGLKLIEMSCLYDTWWQGRRKSPLALREFNAALRALGIEQGTIRRTEQDGNGNEVSKTYRGWLNVSRRIVDVGTVSHTTADSEAQPDTRWIT